MAEQSELQNPAATSRSEVALVGRLGARVDRRELPSGDQITVFTIVVDRPQDGRRRATGGAAKVDAIACVTVRADVTRRLDAWEAGQWLQAEGVLRRRFWRAGGGLGSAMEVEVTSLRRLPVRR